MRTFVYVHVCTNIAQAITDERTTKTLLHKIILDTGCMTITKPDAGKKTVFWNKVAEAVNSTSYFQIFKVSNKSAKEHSLKMVEKCRPRCPKRLPYKVTFLGTDRGILVKQIGNTDW